MKLLVIGAGGHAKVVVDAALASGWQIAGIVNESGGTPEITDHAVSLGVGGIKADAVIVAVGDNSTRAERLNHFEKLGFAPATIIHPSAIIARTASIGAGSVVFAGVIVNADARVDENVILNTGCTIDHDCHIGAHAHIAPGVNLCGNVRVGEGALVGVGSCAIPGTSIGPWATVGAGSAVTLPIAARVTAAGSPARPLTTSDPE